MVKVLRDIVESAKSIAIGMGITFKHLGKTPVTQQYPDERWALPDRFRGFVHNDVPRCTACMVCAKDCPVDCIYIEMEGKGKDRKMARYAIDYNKCIWCSLCTEHCPTDCITMSHDYDHSVYLRDSLVYEFVDEPVTPYKPPKKKKAAPDAGDAGEAGAKAGAETGAKAGTGTTGGAGAKAGEKQKPSDDASTSAE
jgi:NADH-quinone oxidoreductase chain I